MIINTSNYNNNTHHGVKLVPENIELYAQNIQ